MTHAKLEPFTSEPRDKTHKDTLHFDNTLHIDRKRKVVLNIELYAAVNNN